MHSAKVLSKKCGYDVHRGLFQDIQRRRKHDGH